MIGSLLSWWVSQSVSQLVYLQLNDNVCVCVCLHKYGNNKVDKNDNIPWSLWSKLTSCDEWRVTRLRDTQRMVVMRILNTQSLPLSYSLFPPSLPPRTSVSHTHRPFLSLPFLPSSFPSVPLPSLPPYISPPPRPHTSPPPLLYSLQLTLQQGANGLLLRVQPYLHLSDTGVFDLTQPADDSQPWADTLENLSAGEQVRLMSHHFRSFLMPNTHISWCHSQFWCRISLFADLTIIRHILITLHVTLTIRQPTILTLLLIIILPYLSSHLSSPCIWP